ncbi:MAG: RNA polymerase sigma factor [Muribaculum sp.]|nr:RNA polymerase sigma factor [Muribaculum sp.]
MKSTDMKQLIAETYLSHLDKLVSFISKKVNDRDDAEDIAQDAFMRLLNYDREIIPDNIHNLLFTIANNLVNDYLRHLYIKNDVHANIIQTANLWNEDTEQKVVAKDLAILERKRLDSMPDQRRIIYIMRMHEGRNSQEIANRLGISKRTAENHFHLGITQMREYFRACV